MPGVCCGQACMASPMTTQPWTCPSCATVVATAYCPQCGERRLGPRDLRLRALLHQAFHALTSVDGRLVRSLREITLHPGALTLAYLQGRRRQFLGPLQLFFLANVAFFALQAVSGVRSFSTTLDSHLHHQDWSAVAGVLVARHLRASGQTLAEYAPVFDRAIGLYAKSLIVLMVVPFAMLVALLFRQRPLPPMAHATFAVHTYVFLLMLLCLASLAAGIDRLVGGPALQSPVFDHTLSVVALTACALHLHVAIDRVYPGKRAWTALRALVLTTALALIFMGYRFALLPITLWMT